MNSKISFAIAAILSAAAFAANAAEPAPPVPDNVSGGLDEITVTAQRRSQNMQDVPIAMQAITSAALQQLNITTFDDYIKYLPNITSASNGPGQNEVFMRGLSAGSQASQGSAATGLSPNVAVYLDNQSGQMPNRNLDVYAADLNRIEVLEGPQGTLFGAGAEAGVIRYITNEPKLNVTEGSAKAGFGTTAHGNSNSDAQAVLNLPLIEDTMAIRGVVYTDSRGGYIDNVPGTFTRSNTDVGIGYAGGSVPPGSQVLNNYSLTGRGINPVNYQGMRVELLYKFNDNWDALITQSYQQITSQGVFYQQPNASDGAPLNPLEVTLFNPSSNKDQFESTALTINGKFSDIKAVYTGGYLSRHVDQYGDYTNYVRGVYADYYQCYGASDAGPAKCYSPSSAWRAQEKNEHMQHEFRLSTPDDWRLRGIAGFFYEDNKLYDETAWQYRTVPSCTSNGTAGVDPGNTNCFSDVGTFPGTTVQHPGVQNSSTSFYQDTRRETKQTALFASVDLDIIPKVLTATVGTRHFKFDNSYVGSVISSFGCFQAGVQPGGCHNPAYSYNLDASGLTDSESGNKSRANLTWHVTPDAMVYYTWSQGFRPGAFNQNGGTQHVTGTDGQWQYALPRSYVSDSLTNNEFGWKTEFLNRRLQWNGAIYRENWDNVQISFFNPGLVGNLFYNTNGQNFVIKGFETSLVMRVAPGLTVQGAGSWNQSTQTNSPALINNNPASNTYGKPITQNCNTGTCVPVVNPFGPTGAPTANSPPLQYNLRARYEWTMDTYNAFAQLGGTHNGHSFTQAGSNPTISGGPLTTSRLRFENPAYTTVSGAIGVSKDAWNVSIYGENLTNSNASTFVSTDQFIVAQTPLRPRIIGLTMGYKF